MTRKKRQNDVSVCLKLKPDKYVILIKKANKLYLGHLLHDIINPPKQRKKLNIHYNSILQGYMNIRQSKLKFNNVCILFR